MLLRRLLPATAVLPLLAHHTLCAQELRYPDAPRVEHVDDYHGVLVPDPYRWLEDDVRESAAVKEWVDAENELTFSFLEKIPARQQIRQRLTELWNYERTSAPTRVGERYVFSRNDGLQNQSVVYLQDALDGEPRVLFDPNQWTEDGTEALSGTVFSEDGNSVAYGIAEAGSDWQVWKIRDVVTGTDHPETIRWTKFSRPEWTKDGTGFFYSRYDAPEEGAFVTVNKFQKLYYHRLGTPQDKDVLVYHRPDEPDWGFGAAVSDDDRYLVITVWKGTGDSYRVLVKDLREPYGMPVDLIDRFEAEYSFLGNDGRQFYFKTNWQAPLGRVIAIHLDRPEKEAWREIIPESKDTLSGVTILGNCFLCTYLQDARSAVRLYRMDGEHLRDVELPGLGSAGGFNGHRGDTETFYTFSSFAVPPSIYRYDLLTGESDLWRRAEVDFDSDQYETQQVFYRSRDGTRVPMFLTHRKGLTKSGDQPTLLYGYGGFNIPMTPGFSVSRAAWLEMGGLLAIANLRGGGEYGETWHEAGTRTKKQNVFDDFIAAAEWLIENGYTRSERLAIQGGSNGGLLVGACMTQRPELYGACLPAVGVMDMLRFHKFTIGWAWVDDYGSSDNPEEFEALHAYSPYHQIRPDRAYPATLITTADTDDRVVPGHSFKFAAALQNAQAGPAPTLIRIETRAGHGAGKPTSKQIEEVADQWAFLHQALGMDDASN